MVGSDDVTLHATGAAGTFADPNVADNIVVQVSSLAMNGHGDWQLHADAADDDGGHHRGECDHGDGRDRYQGVRRHDHIVSHTSDHPGSLAPGDTANFTETFDTKNVGTDKTLTPSGTVSDGNSGNNYAVTFVPARPARSRCGRSR